MSKLKCNHCGHLNPIQSEFMTFCDRCGKKLSNNFQEWKKFNPSKSFNDYKDEIGTNIALPEISSPKKSNIGMIIGLIIGALLMAEGYHLGFTGLRNFNAIVAERAYTDYLEESVTWRLKEDKAGNFKIRFPGNPAKDIQTKEIADETVYYVSYALEAYPDVVGNSFFGITFSKYPPKVIEEFNRNHDLFFDEFYRSHANSMRGLIKESFVDDYYENPGKVAIVSLEEGEFELMNWTFIVGNTQYLLQTVCPVQNTRNKMIDKFFGSFELLEN